MSSKAAARKLPCGRSVTARKREWDQDAKQDLKELLTSFLKSRGLKYTEQRWQIVEVILDEGGHRDSQSIISLVSARHPEIGAATVYRNLKILCDAKILEESHHREGRTFYEIRGESHHDHMICNQCGEIFEFHNSELEALQEKIAKQAGFRLTDHRHLIFVDCDRSK